MGGFAIDRVRPSALTARWAGLSPATARKPAKFGRLQADLEASNYAGQLRAVGDWPDQDGRGPPLSPAVQMSRAVLG
jgi:hypothetical protein